MTRRLLEYNPPIDSLIPLPGAAFVCGDEIDATTGLLENVRADQAEAYLVDLIDRAARHRLAAPAAGALAHLLGHAARRVLRQRDAQRSTALGRLFGLELEGLSGEDQHFEIARQFVRLARAAALAALAAQAARPRLPPALRAQQAAAAAARRFAPGLAPLVGASPSDPGARARAALGTSRPPSMPGAGFRSLPGASHA
jgi:hypothetical protein